MISEELYFQKDQDGFVSVDTRWSELSPLSGKSSI